MTTADGNGRLTPKAFGALVRRLREERGLTQAELAEAVGASVRQVRSWEKGGTPRQHNRRERRIRERLAEWLGVDEAALPRQYERQDPPLEQLHAEMERLRAADGDLEASIESVRSAVEELRIGLEDRLGQIEGRLEGLGG